ncbi:MAG TPA: helix-turn-helix transcriptional regulator [Candidatus Hydrogenedentes bacterium]|jgi:plasmid maintenance system antidote protein VapI|nr:helix-turn-helix transcriptional regulator [Candidatus Hydrogenedentota bacterium]
MKVSDILKQQITACGLSHRELSKQSGVDRRCIGRFVKGEIMLSLEAVDVLVDFFGLELTPKKHKQKEF